MPKKRHIHLPISNEGRKGKKKITRPSTRETCGTCDARAIDVIVQINDEQQDWKRWSIYKVPAYIVDLNRKAYRPQVVSFGPYHHGKDRLRPMESHKRRVCIEFLKRSGKPFMPFLQSLREVVGDLKANYDALHLKCWEGASWQDGFLELMVTDGCFMLEILMHAARKLPGYYEDNDPIFSKHGELYVMEIK